MYPFSYIKMLVGSDCEERWSSEVNEPKSNQTVVEKKKNSQEIESDILKLAWLIYSTSHGLFIP